MMPGSMDPNRPGTTRTLPAILLYLFLTLVKLSKTNLSTC